MKKTLIAYFSYSGTTETMAREIQKRTGGDLFRLNPVKVYLQSYNRCVEEAKLETERNERPALAENLSENTFSEYDTVFIGYPIWWYDAPMIVYTFLESHGFTDKTVVPFATSGGSGFCGSEEKIAKITGAEVKKGMLLKRLRFDEKFDAWLKAAL